MYNNMLIFLLLRVKMCYFTCVIVRLSFYLILELYFLWMFLAAKGCAKKNADIFKIEIARLVLIVENSGIVLSMTSLHMGR